MNKTKRVAWHKHLKSMKRRKEKPLPRRASPQRRSGPPRLRVLPPSDKREDTLRSERIVAPLTRLWQVARSGVFAFLGAELAWHPWYKRIRARPRREA